VETAQQSGQKRSDQGGLRHVAVPGINERWTTKFPCLERGQN